VLKPLNYGLKFTKGRFVLGGEFQKNGGVFNIALELFGFLDCCLQAASLL
jgi:hypothetical protein